ncbi:MAG: hypothetical protein IKJ29_03400 [Akkermansia sp.]|nr:hypothetical protein [Akkermansia sp.]
MGNDILQAIPQLEQDIPADQFMVQSFWEPLAWVCAILIPLACLAAWWLYRRNQKAAAPLITPVQEALRALDELDSQLPPMRECALRLSMILRSFLAGQTQDPALYETHEEFSQRMDSLAGVPVSCQLETRDLLEHLAEFKYAGETAHDVTRVHGLVERARQLVSSIDAAQLQELQNQKEDRV